MIAILLSIVLVFLAYWYFVLARHPAKFPPGPRFTIPLLGNALYLGADIRSGFNKMMEQYGNICGFMMGPNRFVVISDLDLIQEASSKLEMQGSVKVPGVTYLRGGAVNDGHGHKTGAGVILSSGQTWAEQRRFSLHTLRDLGFGKNAMEQWIAEEVQELCQHLEKESCEGREAIFTEEIIAVAVLNNLWAITAGERMQYDNPKLMSLVSSISRVIVEATKPLNLMSQQSEFISKIGDKFNLFEFPQVVRGIKNLADSNIDTHKASFQEDYMRDFTDYYLAEIAKRTKEPVPSSFKGREGYTNLCNVLIDFFIAGSETTNNTLQFAMLYMIGNPDIQKRVQDELDAVTGRGRPPNIQDRDKTHYTEAVLHEIQRLGSVAALGVPHSAETDTYLAKRRYHIPKDTTIFYFWERVMKDPKIFKDPLKFDPTRYLDKNGNFVPHPYVLPFGVGRRRCLGENLARMSLYLFFSGILSRFDLGKANDNDALDFDPVPGMTLRPKPYKLRFKPRK